MSVVILSEPGTLAFFEKIEAAIRDTGLAVEHIRHDKVSALGTDALSDAEVLVAYGTFPCTGEMMRRAPRLRAVVSPWVGTEGFDLAEATRLGVAVVNGQPVEHTQGMAEATVMLVLAACYGLPEALNLIRTNQPRPARPRAELLQGKTVGIVGFGKIGQTVAGLLHRWGLAIKVHDPFAGVMPPFVERVELQDLLASSDIVTLHVTLTAETRHLLDAARLRAMKPDAILVNTARGGLIDEEALFDVMSSGHLRGAALDVFEREPLPLDSPLRALPNALLTPHMVGQTRQSRAALIGLAVDNVSRLLSGELPAGLRNSEVAGRWRSRWL